MTLNYGPITNPKTNKSRDIVVKTITVVNIRDLLIGSFLIITGVRFLVRRAFKNGADSFEEAEYNVLDELNLFY